MEEAAAPAGKGERKEKREETKWSKLREKERRRKRKGEKETRARRKGKRTPAEMPFLLSNTCTFFSTVEPVNRSDCGGEKMCEC